MDPQTPEPGKGYAMSGKIMLTAIVVLFAVIVALVVVHLYLRWYFYRLHFRQQHRRRHRRTQLVFYSDNNNPRPAGDRGLAPEVLNSLPVFPFSSKAAVAGAGAAELPLLECAVCLSEFGENDAVRLLPKCNHSFHIGCIDMWFYSHSTCPLCRSAVEPVANQTVPAPAAEGAEEASGSDPGSSSGSGLCSTCQHEGENGSSLGGRMKSNGGAMAMCIEVAPQRLAPLDNELTQSSPGTRFASLKRLLSMSKKSPVGGCGSSPRGAGTSRGAAELDLEVGISEPARAE